VTTQGCRCLELDNKPSCSHPFDSYLECWDGTLSHGDAWQQFSRSRVGYASLSHCGLHGVEILPLFVGVTGKMTTAPLKHLVVCLKALQNHLFTVWTTLLVFQRDINSRYCLPHPNLLQSAALCMCAKNINCSKAAYSRCHRALWVLWGSWWWTLLSIKGMPLHTIILTQSHDPDLA